MIKTEIVFKGNYKQRHKQKRITNKKKEKVVRKHY